MRAELTHVRPAVRHRRRSGSAARRTRSSRRGSHRGRFGALLHFRKVGAPPGPRVLVIAALAGHFATLLRDTVATLLPDHDVYITDWFNARDVPLSAGRFGLDDYIAHVVDYLELLGPGTHLLGVCQPCPAALAATAILAARGSDCVPRSLTLMAGPVDTRHNPTVVNDLATSTPLSWFEDNVIFTVPLGHAGAGRRVYPGFRATDRVRLDEHRAARPAARDALPATSPTARTPRRRSSRRSTTSTSPSSTCTPTTTWRRSTGLHAPPAAEGRADLAGRAGRPAARSPVPP